MPRVQVNPLAAPDLRPVAAPVDRFEQTDAGEQLAQLADSLKSLAPDLAQFGSTIFQQNKEADTKAGTAEANRIFQDIQETGRQIKAGEIAPHESRWFRAAAQEQLGRLHAAKFGSSLTYAMDDPNGPLAQSTDPADFDKFSAELRKQYLAENVVGQDMSFSRSFDAGVNEEVLSRRNAFASQAGTRLEKQVIEGTYQEHQQTIEDGLRKGLTMEQIGAAIYQRNTIQYALNPSAGAALSNTMLRAVIDTARKTENLDVLDILSHIPGGPKGSKLSNTSLANKLVPDVIQEIRGARQQRYNLASTEDRNATEDAVEGALGGLYDAMDAAQEAGLSLTTVDPKKFAEAVQAVDPTQVSRVYRAFDAYQKRTEVDDEAISKDLWSQAFRATLTYDAVATAFENGALTQETARKMRQEIKKNRAGRGAAKALTQEPRLQETKTRLRNLFIDQYGINRPEMKLRSEFAVQDLENEWINWRRGEGAGASDEQVNEWLHGATIRHFSSRADADLRGALKDSFVPPTGGTTGPQPEKWEKAAVVPPDFLGTLAGEIDKFHRTPHYQFPPAVEEVLRRNNIKNITEAEDFLKKQRSFIPAR